MADTTGKHGGIKKSALMTPDPYHVPGYGGFCPQFKYQIGKTFGQTTCCLLDNKDVASSGRLVLANIDPAMDMEKQSRSERVNVIHKRTQSWGDQKLMEEMVPGYTGFIPRSQHYFGKRYAENCVNAICDFELKAQNSKSLPPIQSQDRLKPIAAEAKPYLSKNSPHHTMSPYYMKNSNPDKRFVSGYTGFVPRARGLIGEGYPYITNQALNEFTDNTTRLKTLASQPVTVKRCERVNMGTKPIYPADSGLVPHYTGHIPGEKFSYGSTFGHSTMDALGQIPVSVSN